jgi:type IV pilus assembly protein PilB
LNLVVAQRLVRRICEKCKEETTLSEKVLKKLKIDSEQAKKAKFYHGKGCSTCGDSGYLGRLPIFEFLVVDSEMRQKITIEASEPEIRKLARQKGYGGLLESGVIKIMEGLTTAEEVLSTTFAEDIIVQD